MVIKTKQNKTKLTVLVVLSFFLINYQLYPIASSNSNFSVSLEKGSQIFEVVNYNEETWKDVINATSNPTDWFGGDSDTIGAKSKVTVLGVNDGGSSTYGQFIKLFFSWFDVNSSILWLYGYDQMYFSINYPKGYHLWYPQLTSWSFGTEPFDDYSKRRIHEIDSFLFRELSDFQSTLSDYNDFAAVVNNDTALQAINFSMPILSGDDFLWYFILDRYVMVNPINNYLTEVITELECENVSVHGNIITFMRFGENAYNVEFTYSPQGLLDTIIVRDNNSNLIYKITSSNLKFVVFIIIGICSGAILGLIGFSFYKKRRLNLVRR